MICHNKTHNCFFILGLSYKLSKIFSKTLLIWASTTFCGYPLLQNPILKFSRCFWKVNGDEQRLLILKPLAVNNWFFVEKWMSRIKMEKVMATHGFTKQSVSIFLSAILTSHPKELTGDLDSSCVNFKFGWKLLRRFKDPSSLSSPSV